jgi:peptidoglycan/xylan/chitin deacetylase (PgdA/CDA1 family)
MGGAEEKMRFVLFVVCCLIAGIASGFAQSVSTQHEAAATPLSAQPVSPPAEQQAAEPVEQPAAPPVEQAAKPVEQSATPPVEQAETPVEQSATPLVEHAAKPVEQSATPPVEQAEKQGEQPVAPPADQAAKPTEQSAAPPIEQAAKPAEQPAAQPVEQTAIPAEQAVAQPAEPAVEQPAAKPAEQPDAQPSAKKVATAAEPACPGHPDAIGTSRAITIPAGDVSLLGTIQYKKTLPLKDHEVVLTFDDGPIPPYTNSILDTLAANCVKATYFLVGEMAHARPYLVRRIYNEGHSIGTHTQHHPFAMQHLSMQRVEREVDGGIESVESALGDPKAISPFFRIPGLGRTNAIEHFLEHRGLVTWSADVDTNDWWRGTTPSALIQRAMRRLNAKGRGILLMHDIHPATALALPALLKRLKESGYHVVQVVAAGERPKTLPEVVATPAEKENWPRVLHAKSGKNDAATSALRHRVKRAIANRHRHRAARHTTAAKIDYTANARFDRNRPF